MASEGWGLRTVKLEDKSLVVHRSSGTEQHPVLFCLISNTRLGTTLTAVEWTSSFEAAARRQKRRLVRPAGACSGWQTASLTKSAVLSHTSKAAYEQTCRCIGSAVHSAWSQLPPARHQSRQGQVVSIRPLIEQHALPDQRVLGAWCQHA